MSASVELLTRSRRPAADERIGAVTSVLPRDCRAKSWAELEAVGRHRAIFRWSVMARWRRAFTWAWSVHRNDEDVIGKMGGSKPSRDPGG